MNQPLLSVKHLTTDLYLDHGRLQAVRDACFDLKQGRTLGIVGESGCGKSLLCRSILKLLPSCAQISDETRIVFEGRAIHHLPEKEFKRIRGRDLAMVFQDPLTALNPVMKIGSQITEALVYQLGMEEKEALKQAENLLNAVGIPNPVQRIDQYPHQLSGGLRQRVAIAIALACEPKVLIADEPTTALDVTVQADILDLLGVLQIQAGMAILLVTHDVSLAACRTDDIAVMYGGRIVEYAPTSQLMKFPRMPYTKALIDATPRLEDPPHTPLQFIQGQPPNLMNDFPGCCFEPRCAYATRRCREREPLLTAEGKPDHFFACWHPLEIV